MCLRIESGITVPITPKQKKYMEVDQDGGVRGHGTHLPPQTHQIHLHVEQFSQKTNWKLAEDLLHKQSCKKDPHITR